MPRKDLPDDIAERVRAARDFEVRQGHHALAQFTDTLDPPFRELAKVLDKGPRAVKRAVRKWHDDHTWQALRGAVAEAVDASAESLSRRDKAVDELAPPVSIAVAQKLARMQPKGRTLGDNLAKRHLKPNANVGTMRHLRSAATSAASEAARRVPMAMKEARQLAKDAEVLAKAVKKLSKTDPDEALRQIDALRARGRKLAALSGARDGWAVLDRELRRIRRSVVAGLPKKGMAQGVRDVGTWAKDQPDGALRATTIEKTEHTGWLWIPVASLAAHRGGGIAGDRFRPWIIGYRWQLNRALHGAAVRRRFGTTGKGLNRRARRRGRIYCICEVMDGHVLSPAEMARYPRGGHPNCRCSFPPVYSPVILAAAGALLFAVIPTEEEEE